VSTSLPGITAIGPTDDIISIDSRATVAAGGRLVALIGVEDLVVIDTQDALLITSPDRVQEVKQVVEILTARGRTDLT
jgi:mannose-1-phosphate guanylyltransferase